jgi:hypothetical protein
MHYKYVIDLDERGQFQAHVEDHGGKTVWEVSYPEYYQDDETGEEMENSTIFDDGYMKNTEDVEGLENYLKQVGTMPQEAELKSEEDFEENDDDEDEFAEGGYNPAQEIIDSIYGSAGKVYRVVADIGDDKVGMTAWYTKAVIEDVIKEITDKGYKIINVEEKDDSYMEGGEITEYKGTKAFTVNFKTYRNFPAAWRVIFFWGGTKPFVEVTKVTNNPFGGRLGTDFETLDKAIAHYKSPEMKVLLMQAADVAKKAGVPMDNFASGGIMAEGGDVAKATLLLIDSVNPLSAQVQKITGDTLNTGDYKDIAVGNFNILTHKKSGKLFVVYPKRIYDQLPKEAKQDDIDYLKKVEKISFASGGIMAEGGVIGSSPTKEGIEKVIGKYYYSSNISLHQRGGTNEYDVHNAKGKVNGVKVVEKKGRYQFVEDKDKMADGGEIKKMKVDVREYKKEAEQQALETIKTYGIEKTKSMVSDVINELSSDGDAINNTYQILYYSYFLKFVKEEGGTMADGGLLKEDDFVWNEVGKKLVVDKVTDTEYFLKGFMQPSANPFSKNKVDTYIKLGKWSLKPKMADGGETGKTKNFKEMTFKEKSASIQAKLRGRKVSPKYRKKYGKTYDSKEAKEAADAITGKIVSKMKE